MTGVVNFLETASSANICELTCSQGNHDKQIELVRESALFAGLSIPECGEILGYARAKTFVRDDLLFRDGQVSDIWILIRSGNIKLTQLTSDGNEVILWINGCGDAVGIQADTLSGRQTCTARAMDKCAALVWHPREIHVILARHPLVRRNIATILSTRLRELEERFREVASESVPDRLALTLLRLAKPLGKQSKYGVELHLRRQDLAQMTGTTLHTVSRILSSWARQGFVESRREGVSVLNPQLLLANTCGGRRAMSFHQV